MICLKLIHLFQPIPSSNPFASDVAMSSSYSEISGVDQNYEKMDIEEDLVDYDKEPKTRPDSIVSYDGQCKLAVPL